MEWSKKLPPGLLTVRIGKIEMYLQNGIFIFRKNAISYKFVFLSMVNEDISPLKSWLLSLRL